MSQKILVTRFKYDLTPEEYKQLLTPFAQTFADVPGCLWKIWLNDEEKHEGGAIYLFRDEKSFEDFKASPLVAAVLGHPALSDFDLRECDIIKDLSEVTRAPLMETSLV